MVLITTTTEIACSPAHLRKIVSRHVENRSRPDRIHPADHVETNIVPRLPTTTSIHTRLHPLHHTPNSRQTSHRAPSRRQTHRATRRDVLRACRARTSSYAPKAYAASSEHRRLTKRTGELRTTVYVARYRPFAPLRRPLLPL
jgi:hypothetical protein